MPLGQSPEPLAHADSLRQFVRFAQAQGVPLEGGFDAGLLATDEAFVPARAMIEGLERCAAAAARPDLGIAFAAWADLRGHGPLSELTGHVASVREALEYGLRYMHLVNGALVTVLEDEGDEVALRRLCTLSPEGGGRQFMESVLLVTVRIVRAILGEDWAPVRVEVGHGPPADLRRHRTLFRAPLRFGCERHAVILTKADLERPASAADLAPRPAIEGRIAALSAARPGGFVLAAQRAMVGVLAQGEPRLAAVAEALGMSPRTLQRRLADLGGFGGLLAEIRAGIAQDYLRTTERPSLTELAHRLGFADASGASRFLRATLRHGLRA